MKVSKDNLAYLKTHVGFSYLLSAEEERVLKHMKELDYFRRIGHKVDYTRAEYAKRMALGIITFDRCIGSLCRIGLISKIEGSSRNKVHYSLNNPAYNRLVQIVSTTMNTDRLTQFFDFHIFQLGKTIPEITDQDIEALRPKS
jgi:hypothetical protein